MITEALLAVVVDHVFTYLEQRGVTEKILSKFNLDSNKQAFKRALWKAFNQFDTAYPQWSESLFNMGFFEREGSPVIAQFLLRDGHPNPSELATLWAKSLNLSSARRTTLIREIEPAATDFLDNLAEALKNEPALKETNDSRSFEELTKDVKEIRHKIGADEATTGTLRDYLQWVINRNIYLDLRGIRQTQRQVQIKLDEVYVSLRAQNQSTNNIVDRRLLENELTEIDTQIAQSWLTTEEKEDLHEQLIDKLRNRSNSSIRVNDEILDLSEVALRHKYVVILGDPGSGKSTLLRYLALHHARALWSDHTEVNSDLGRTQFPILLRIADYAEYGLPKGKSLNDFLSDYCNLHECPMLGTTDLLQRRLEEGNCIILLDGLDEVVSADERRKVVERIEGFIRHHDRKSNRFIITSRIAGYRSSPLSGLFVHYEIQGMDKHQIQRFLEQWCNAVESAQTPELSSNERGRIAQREIDGITNAVENSPGVQRLATNPLLLTILALIYRTSAQIPQKRIELYRLAADTLARTWRPAQGVSELALLPIKDEYLTPLLSKLAYWLHVNRSTGIAMEQEVYKILGEEWAYLNDIDWDEDDFNPKIKTVIDDFLRTVREHTGIFVERVPSGYGFMHLTFEEYYAARYLVASSRKRIGLIRRHLHDPRWNEPILLGLGFVGMESLGETRRLVETAILGEGNEAAELGLISSPHERLLGRDYLFALRCLADDIPASPKLVNKLVKRLADELLHGSGSARFQPYYVTLAQRCEQLKGTQAASLLLSFLIAAFADSDPETRQSATRCLRNEHLQVLSRESLEVKQKLVDLLLHDPDRSVRLQALKSLVALNPESLEVADALVTVAQQDPEAEVREEAVRHLGHWSAKIPDVQRTLSTIVQHDTSLTTRKAAIWSLGYLRQKTPEAALLLAKALQQESDKEVRLEILICLHELAVKNPEIREVLIFILQHDSNAQMRSEAASLIGLWREGRTVEEQKALIDALQNDSDAKVRLSAVQGLHRWGEKHTAEELIALIAVLQSDPDESVCCAIIESLHPEEALELANTLITILERNRHAQVRCAAAEILARHCLESPIVSSVLMTALGHDSAPSVRCAVVKSMKSDNEEPETTEVIMALIVALQADTSPEVRCAVAENLRQWDKKPETSEVMPALIATLSYDTNSEVRSAAAWTLAMGYQNSSLVLNALFSTLQSEQEQLVRARVALALEKWGTLSPELASTLIEIAQHDTDPNVRYIVVRNLGILGKKQPDVLANLTTVAQKDPDLNVRMQAAIILGEMSYEYSVIADTLREVLSNSDIRFDIRKASNLMKQYGRDYDIIDPLLYNIQNTSNDKIRYRCVDMLERLGQSSRSAAEMIVKGLIQIIEDAELNKLFPTRNYPQLISSHLVLEKTPIEHAYDALWTLATCGILEKK